MVVAATLSRLSNFDGLHNIALWTSYCEFFRDYLTYTWGNCGYFYNKTYHDG